MVKLEDKNFNTFREFKENIIIMNKQGVSAEKWK